MNKHTIELSTPELLLIERALDIYSRIGLLQFENIKDCYSLQSLIWKEEKMDEFRDATNQLKAVFGYPPNAGPGIFNTEKVGDDCRIAAHIHQQIRHHRWQIDTSSDKSMFTVNAYPADICQIAEISIPDFKINLL